MRFIVYLLFALSVASAHARQGRSYADSMVDELRLEVSDLKHELHSARVEINLLEEKLNKQERANTAKNLDAPLEGLNKRIDRLEKILDKVALDMRSLNASTARIQELEGSLALQEKKLDEVAKLKNTLAALSKAIGHSIKASTELRAQTYYVKAGDSLEKIARTHNTTVDAIRQLNQLPSDTIRIGQQLTIACDEYK
jgi:LysM repeat protein